MSYYQSKELSYWSAAAFTVFQIVLSPLKHKKISR